MKNNKVALMILLFILYGISQASETCNAQIKEYQNKPSDINEEQPFLDSNEYYLPYDRCSDPTDIEIDSLGERVQMGFIPRDILSFRFSHYNCIFRTIKVEYTIKCSNNLRYKGTEYLLSDIREENESLDVFGTIKADMEAEAHWDWKSIPLDYLNSDGSITIDPVTGKKWEDKPKKLNIYSIKERWIKQKVKYPEYTYMGTPGRLPRPVLLIHGLDYSHKVWGVEIYDEGSDEFRTGKVKKYENGSLPDMLARSNNLYTEKDTTNIGGVKYDINSNGIYFFQSPRDDKGEDAKPHWGVDSNTSQSYALYEKIKFVMNDFYKEKLGIEWWLSDEYQIDLVGHSQGGLVIREMLRGLRANPPDSKQGNENAANHINRVITVNTPHFGSALATKKEHLDSIKQEYPGLATLINDIEEPIDHTLVKANVDVGFWEKYTGSGALVGITSGATIALGVGLGIALGPFGAILGVAIGAGSGYLYTDDIDVTLKITGPYLGPYKPKIYTDAFIVGEKPFKELDSITDVSVFKERLEKPRKSGDHLGKNSDFIVNLNERNIDGLFPLHPDGSKITLLPMYSDSTNKILPELFEMAGENSDRLCAQGDIDQNCFAAGVVLKNYAYKMSGYNISDLDFDDGLWDALLSIQNDWLVYGDAVVEANSQKFITNNNIPDNKYFLEPRNYAIHDALASWEPVLHGPFGNNYKGAPQQGLDILCALTPACNNAFINALGNKNAILILSETVVRGGFNEKYLNVTGDFDLAPIFISEGIQAFSISVNGETVLIAKYEPEKGSSITLNYGTEQTELLFLGPKFATQPSIARKGDSVFVSFVNYSGKIFRKDYYLPGLSTSVTATVMTQGSAMSQVIVGNAVATNPETQKLPTPPPGHMLAPVTLAVVHREARGEYESNTSRPRFLVYNATEDTLTFSKVAYYFTADPARVPKVVVDYPYVPVSVENLGGDKWRFVLSVGNQKITPKAFYPSVDGWQIRVHYSDWFEYKHLDDWSADYSLGTVKANRKIVVYDKNGKIIWGNEAPGFESEDNGIVPTPKGTIAWKDDAPWESNSFKPRVTVKNTGSVALSDYHAQLWFRVPQGKKLSVPSPDDWYTPESSPSTKNVGGRVWMLDMRFDKHILYSGDSVSEGNIGLHLTDWSNFDKTVCGIVLKDKDGNVLFGKEPSIVECESYNGPNLLQPLYSLKQKAGRK